VRAVPARRAGALALLLAAACGPGPADGGAAPLPFTVGGLSFELVSGGVTRGGGQLQIYLSDQPSTCLAVAAAPVGRATYLRLVVAPPTAGPQAATVVAPRPVPAAGQAVGDLEQRTGGVLTGTPFDAGDGTLSWSGGASGDVILDAIDVGFVGVAGRVAATGLRLAACN
jgi:hypothetical protein